MKRIVYLLYGASVGFFLLGAVLRISGAGDGYIALAVSLLCFTIGRVLHSNNRPL